MKANRRGSALANQCRNQCGENGWLISIIAMLATYQLAVMKAA